MWSSRRRIECYWRRTRSRLYARAIMRVSWRRGAHSRKTITRSTRIRRTGLLRPRTPLNWALHSRGLSRLTCSIGIWARIISWHHLRRAAKTNLEWKLTCARSVPLPKSHRYSLTNRGSNWWVNWWCMLTISHLNVTTWRWSQTAFRRSRTVRRPPFPS